MDGMIIVGVFIALALLISLLLKSPECQHDEKVYYDADGDEMPGDSSEACFCECMDCGKAFVIPSGFQSDAHFESYLLYGGGPKRRHSDSEDKSN